MNFIHLHQHFYPKRLRKSPEGISYASPINDNRNGKPHRHLKTTLRNMLYTPCVGRDSSVGIATGYGLHGPGIESRWEARFSAPVQNGPGAHTASCTMGTGSFPG